MYEYSETQFEEAVDQVTREYGLDKFTFSSSPTFFVVAGQAGAGKSSTIARLREDNPNLFVIDMNELRKFHPQYGRIRYEQGINAPEFTQEFAGRLRSRIASDLRASKVSFGIERTFCKPESEAELLKSFKECGYHTEVHVVSAPLELSQIDVNTRYFRGRNRTELANGFVVTQARFVPEDIQREQFENLPKSLEHVVDEGCVDYVSVTDRDGQVLYRGGSKAID